ncbi:MAG: PAS domain S-box protein, partial [Nitrospirae bacterium]
MTLKRKIILAWIGVAVLLTLLLSGSAFYILFKTHKRDVEAHLSSLARDRAEEITLVIETYKDMMDNITQSREFSDYLRFYRDEPLLALFKRYAGFFPVISFIDEQGREMLKMVRRDEARTLKDYSKSPFFKRLKKDRVFLLPASPSEEIDQMVIRMFLLKRHYFGNRFMGILMVELPVERLLRQAVEGPKLKGANLIIATSEGTLVFDGKRAIKGAIKRIDLSPLKEEVARISINGQKVLASAWKVKEAGLVVVSVLPYLDFLREPLRLIYISSALVLSFLLFLVLVIIRSTERFLKPIKELVNVTEDIRKGRFSRKIELKAGGEVGKLVNSFNRMIEELDKTMVSKDYVENIIESMVDALIITDSEGQVLHANRAATRLTGYSLRELVSMRIDSLFVEGDSDKEQRTVVSNESVLIEESVRRKDGSILPVSVNASYLEEGEMLFLLRDISTIKEYEKRLL